MTMLRDSPNHLSPHREKTTVATPRHTPTAKPDPSTIGRCDRAWVNAGLITGLHPARAIENANTAFRKKLAAVTAATASTTGITIGPSSP